MPAPELIEVEPSRWDALVRGLGVTDVYYSRGFVEASAPLAGGTATLLHAPGDGGDAVFPCVVRSDPTDVVTPYGYGGPLALGDAPPAFAEAYQAWCERRGVVSSFVVFHPLFRNGGAPFRTSPLAGTVAWRLDGGDLLAAMHSHHRRVVRRARERLEVAIDPAPADLDEFVAVYEHTMRRSDASAFYFFGAPYWDALLEGVPLVRVDVREPGGDLLSSVLGMGDPPFLHYHLGGTADAGRKAGASHVALYSLARWGQEHGYTRLHLGGGVGGRDDSLLEFKRRFAPDGLVPATIGKAVHDEAAYRRLAGAEIDWDGFFPAYRAPH